MIKHFPEIEAFFKQDYFSEDDLDLLKNELKKAYIKKIFFDKAMSLIALFLIKFKLSSPKELNEFKLNGIARPIKREQNKELRSSKSSPKKKIKRTVEQKDKTINGLNRLRNKTLSAICEDLNISLNLVTRILKKKDIDQISNDKLDSKQFEELKQLLISKLKAKNRLKKENNKIFRGSLKKSKRHKSTTGRNVYETLSKYGMGKVIYIRSK